MITIKDKLPILIAKYFIVEKNSQLSEDDFRLVVLPKGDVKPKIMVFLEANCLTDTNLYTFIEDIYYQIIYDKYDFEKFYLDRKFMFKFDRVEISDKKLFNPEKSISIDEFMIYKNYEVKNRANKIDVTIYIDPMLPYKMYLEENKNTNLLENIVDLESKISTADFSNIYIERIKYWGYGGTPLIHSLFDHKYINNSIFSEEYYMIYYKDKNGKRYLLGRLKLKDLRVLKKMLKKHIDEYGDFIYEYETQIDEEYYEILKEDLEKVLTEKELDWEIYMDDNYKIRCTPKLIKKIVDVYPHVYPHFDEINRNILKLSLVPINPKNFELFNRFLKKYANPFK